MCVSNIIIQGEEEAELEEESEAAEEMPDVVDIEVIHQDAVPVHGHWLRSSHWGVLHLDPEEYEGKEHEGDGEDKEEQAGVGEGFSSSELFCDVEQEVEEEVGDEDVEQNGGEVNLCHKRENADESVDQKEDKDCSDPVEQDKLVWTSN